MLVKKYQFSANKKQDEIFQIHLDQLGKKTFFGRFCFIHSFGEGRI